MDTPGPGDNSSACSSTMSASNTYDGAMLTPGIASGEYDCAVTEAINEAVQRMADQDEDDDEDDYVSVGNAVAAAVTPAAFLSVDAINGMTFVEESGYSDPLGNTGGKEFDLLDYLNGENSNINSPMNNSAEFGHLQQQQQQHVNGSGYGGYANNQIESIYPNNNTVSRTAMMGGGVRGAGARLPDSPPITDISAGGLSSASPSSGGSASGDSPFSPNSIGADLYARNYPNNMPINDNILLSMHGGYNNGKPPNGNVNELQQQMLHQRMMMHNQLQQQQQQQKLSPQSEFLSPYPPCQSTPGSQHSSSSGVLPLTQISPSSFSSNVENAGGVGSVPMRNGNNNNNGYVLQQQQLNQQRQQQRAYGSEQLPPIKGEIHQTPNGGYKRRRTDVSVDSGVKSENNFNGSRMNLNNYAQIFQQKQQQQSERSGSSSSGGGGSGSGSSSVNGDVPSSFGGAQPAPPFSHHSNDYDFDDTASLKGNSQLSIKFSPFFPESWLRLYDSCHRPIDPLTVHIVADKGFNYFANENCFVNQKKNHFQITMHISRVGGDPPYWLQMPSGELQQISEFRLHFCGVKSEIPSSEVAINQSHSDRKPQPHDGELLKINNNGMTKQTIPRLHFSQTTMNNHRKNGKSNPEQKFFLLVVKILARTPLGDSVIQAYQSDRVIVRASNPGQFEQPECGVSWQQSASNELLHFNGQVAIGTDKPLDADAKLSVMGNVFTTGQVTRPSDRRVKEDIADLDTSEAMSRISQMRIVEYNYKKEIAEKWGIEQNRHRVGVIAQELGDVLPDAVRDNGEFLTVDDTRIFYDTVAAAQELYRLTGNLECKIDQVEKISQKLARFAQRRRQLGSMASGISDFSNFFGTTAALNGGSNGLESKAFMSQSRASLTSASAAPYASDLSKKRKTKRHQKADENGYRRCRSVSSASSYSYCHRGRVPDNALCSSKVTQGTIVTLVVIMALCLVAMCTLYVMDWYNRTYIYAPSMHYHHTRLPDLPPDLRPHPGNDDLEGGIGHHTTIYEPENPWSSLVDTIKLTRSGDASLAGPYCMASSTRNRCSVFCCAVSSDVRIHGIAAEINDTAMPGHVQVPTATIALATDSEPSGRLDPNVRIDVLNLDTTLDAGYCAPNNGCDPRAGHFNLYVPISQFLPTIPLQLKFNVPHGLFVDNCQKLNRFQGKVCHDFDGATAISRRLSETTFEVPAGGFLKSGYTFRVGYTTESCRMDSSQIGRAFDEYNIAFFRVCDMDIDTVRKNVTH